MLLILQCLMAGYLITVKPFIDSALQVSEVVCHCLEVVLFSCALALLFGEPPSTITYGLHWTMIGELHHQDARHSTCACWRLCDGTFCCMLITYEGCLCNCIAGCFLGVIATLFAFEMRRVVVLIWQAWVWYRDRKTST